MFIRGNPFQSQMHWFLREWRESDSRFQKVANGTGSGTLMLQGTSKNDAWPKQDGSTYKGQETVNLFAS
jgi:hypothetical protein